MGGIVGRCSDKSTPVNFLVVYLAHSDNADMQ